MWAVRLSPSPTGLSCGSFQAPPRSPGSRAWSFQTCVGSTTTQDWPGTRAIVPDHVAFRFDDSVGVPIAIFRSSIPSPSVPLFTLQWWLHSAHCKTRGRVDRYSFLVRISHPLLHAGLSRRTVKLFSSSSSAALHLLMTSSSRGRIAMNWSNCSFVARIRRPIGGASFAWISNAAAITNTR